MFSLLAFFGFSLIIILPWILCATKRKFEPINNNNGNGGGGGGAPKGGYKPGHLPEFADPDVKETNTFYDVQSVIAFPNKDENGKATTPPTIPATPNTAAAHEPSVVSKTPSNVGANGNGNVAAAPTATQSTAGTAAAKTAMNTK
uniref:Uncharacterized protein n=1 Tax=Panagrolaimus sp. ES5 TaxID=591445 RepID=A0AC34G889_9BILA